MGAGAAPARRSPAVRLAAVVLAAAWLAGCGDLVWPPPHWQTAGSAGGARQQRPEDQSDPMFIGASAVVVGKGDTVYALSRRHKIPPQDIIRANGLTPPYHLVVGQRIALPRGQLHTVERGETLYAISRRYGVNVYDLARLNDVKPPYTIYVGDRLRIPGTTRVAESGGTATTGDAAGTATRSTDGGATAVSPAPTTTVQPASLPKPAAIPTPPPVTDGFAWPVQGRVLSGFGAKERGLRNDGINIAAARGAEVRAAENGVVVYAGNELRGFGNLLLVKHANGYVTAYAHADRLLVKRGDNVTKGQPIATVGATGNVTEPQLHFEVRKGKKALDPISVLPKTSV